MGFRSAASVAMVGLLALACGSTADDDGAAGGSPGAGASTGGAGGTGGATSGGRSNSGAGTGGTMQAGAGAPGVGGAGTAGGTAMGGAGGMGTAGGGPAGMGPGAGAGGMDPMSAGGMMSGDGGMGDGGMSGRGMGRGGRGSGGVGTAGMGTAGMGMAGMGAAGMGLAGSASSGCPASGHVTYTLTKVSSPTADQQEAYDLITEAMDKALEYYNCYTNITKAETVTYNTGVETADGNSNGSIRFGGHQYMEYSRAMHEIAHTVGVGTYNEFHDLTVNGIFTGEAATAQVRINTGNPDEVVHADTQHFWPGGLNYASEAGSEKDVIDHCLMVVAIRKDMGFDP